MGMALLYGWMKKNSQWCYRYPPKADPFGRSPPQLSTLQSWGTAKRDSWWANQRNNATKMLTQAALQHKVCICLTAAHTIIKNSHSTLAQRSDFRDLYAQEAQRKERPPSTEMAGLHPKPWLLLLFTGGVRAPLSEYSGHIQHSTEDQAPGLLTHSRLEAAEWVRAGNDLENWLWLQQRKSKWRGWRGRSEALCHWQAPHSQMHPRAPLNHSMTHNISPTARGNASQPPERSLKILCWNNKNACPKDTQRQGDPIALPLLIFFSIFLQFSKWHQGGNLCEVTSVRKLWQAPVTYHCSKWARLGQNQTSEPGWVSTGDPKEQHSRLPALTTWPPTNTELTNKHGWRKAWTSRPIFIGFPSKLLTMPS